MATPAIARLAEERVNDQRRRIERLREYADGTSSPLPYAPDESDPAHLYLREQASLPTLRLAVRALTKRLRVTGYSTGDKTRDEVLVAAWEAARMGGKHRGCVEDSVVAGAGIVSVWPNASDPNKPHIVVEDPADCWHEPSVSGSGYDWAAKRWAKQELVNQRAPRLVTVEMVTVYEPHEVTVFAKRAGRWRIEPIVDDEGSEVPNPSPNPFGDHLALVQIAPDRNPKGRPRSWAESLVPGARAINTFRFDMLLAGHAAAFRQLFVSGYDPVQRDEHGQPLWQKNADGSIVTDEHGYPMPILRSPRTGVNQIITFSDPETEIDSVEAVDLQNYVTGLNYLMESFAGAASMPVTSVGGSINQVSAEALEQAAMEQIDLVSDFQDALSEDFERVFDLVLLAMNKAPTDRTSELQWAPGRSRTLGQIGNFIGQTAPHGVPVRVGLEMLPGATPEGVSQWLSEATGPAEEAAK